MKRYSNITKHALMAFFFSLYLSHTASGQQNKHSHVHVGFVYPISSNGAAAGEYTNDFSLHLLTGVSRCERAFTVSGLSTIVRDSANGLQVAGLSNHIRNNARGLQVAGFVNTIGSSTGFQAAGFVNLSKGNVHGAQGAGFLNKAATTDTQFAGFLNIAQQVNAVQAAGFANLSTGNAEGLQAAGFINKAKDADVQLAGFSNLAGNVNAMQASGFVNVAKDVEGIQVAGFMNKSANVDAQFAGFFNVAKKVRGVQVAGFINIADSSEYPIALLNFVKHGEKAIGLTIDETGTTLLAFRSGGHVLYGILGLGYNLKSDRSLSAIEGGLGAHLSLSRSFRINVEAVTTALTDFKRGDYSRSSLRVMPSLKLGWFEIFAGPTFTYSDYSYGKGNDVVNHYVWSETTHSNHFHGLNVGAVGGIQVHF